MSCGASEQNRTEIICVFVHTSCKGKENIFFVAVYEYILLELHSKLLVENAEKRVACSSCDDGTEAHITFRNNKIVR